MQLHESRRFQLNLGHALCYRTIAGGNSWIQANTDSSMRLETKDIATLLAWVVATSVGGYAFVLAVTILRMLVSARRLDGSLHFHFHGYYVVMPSSFAICVLLGSLLISLGIFLLLSKKAAVRL